MNIQQLVVENKFKEIQIGEDRIKVVQYLPSQVKANIIDGIIDLLISKGGIFTNVAYVNALFYGYMIINYSDLELEEINKDVAIKVYDYFEGNGYFADFLAAIPKSEYNSLYDSMIESLNEFNKYRVSSPLAIDKIIANLPVAMERIQDAKSDLKGEIL